MTRDGRASTRSRRTARPRWTPSAACARSPSDAFSPVFLRNATVYGASPAPALRPGRQQPDRVGRRDRRHPDAERRHAVAPARARRGREPGRRWPRSRRRARPSTTRRSTSAARARTTRSATWRRIVGEEVPGCEVTFADGASPGHALVPRQLRQDRRAAARLARPRGPSATASARCATRSPGSTSRPTCSRGRATRASPTSSALLDAGALAPDLRWTDSAPARLGRAPRRRASVPRAVSGLARRSSRHDLASTPCRFSTRPARSPPRPPTRASRAARAATPLRYSVVDLGLEPAVPERGPARGPRRRARRTTRSTPSSATSARSCRSTRSCRRRPSSRASTPTSRPTPTRGWSTRGATSTPSPSGSGWGADSLVVEIASNDGYLLQHAVARGVPCLGVEPAANVAEVGPGEGRPDARRLLRRGRGARDAWPRGSAPT